MVVPISPDFFLNYGALGGMVVYLIYDKQVLQERLRKSIDALADAINRKF